MHLVADTTHRDAARFQPDISVTFSATDLAVRSALHSVRQAMRQYDLTEICIGMLELVIAESCNNIVEHAYEPGNPGMITLVGRYVGGLIEIELSDTGTPMPGLSPPVKKNHDLTRELESLPEGGFGWGLIRDNTVALTYCRTGGRNVLRLTLTAEHKQTRVC